MLGLCILLAFIALACLFGVTAVVVRALALAEKVYADACVVARSQQESATKYLTANVQTANLISEKIDSRVSSRIKVMNQKPGQGALDPIDDAPNMPDVFQSGYVSEDSEIERELKRPRKMEFDYHIRDQDFEEV